jgi:phosphoribosylaminoimidazolecarboxamide formyltransferase / IMP cyclohydrolase
MNRVTAVPDRLQVSNVLVSVSDKRELENLVPALLGIEAVTLYSTGGTYDRILTMLEQDQRHRLKMVSDYTGQPEMQGGLVKTLDYKIYLGLLSEPYNTEHAADRQRVGAQLIDMVVVNLYPFRSVANRPDSDFEDARGNIDIGGPCMLRAAAKSFLRVAAVCDPTDYEALGDELGANAGSISLRTRFRLAQKAFGHTAQYDRAIADYLSNTSFESVSSTYSYPPLSE